MKRLVLALAIGGLAALAACDDVREPQTETAPPPPVEEPAPPVAVPPAEAPPTTAPLPSAPTDGSALPPDQRPSEDTVKPESETLFY